MHEAVKAVFAGVMDASVHDADKARIMRRQGFACFYCDEPLFARYVFDHFVPRSKGGSHEANNRVAACGPCNGAKGNRMPTDAERDKLRKQINAP